MKQATSQHRISSVIAACTTYVILFSLTSSLIPRHVDAAQGEAVAVKVSEPYVMPTPRQTPEVSHSANHVYYNVPLSNEIQDYIQDIMVEYGLPLGTYKYVLALIKRESNFTADAKNTNADGSTDVGYMQINSTNFDWMTETIGVPDCTTPENNLRCGVFYLRELYITCGNSIEYALIGYRRGPNQGLQYQQLGILDDYAKYIIDTANSFTFKR